MISLLLLSAFAAAFADTIDLDHTKSSVDFYAVGKPSFLKIHGTGAKPHGKFMISPDHSVSGQATLDLDSLDTGISMRNEHMKKKYLETAKYPKAKFTLTHLNLPADFGSPQFSKTDIPFEGKLEIHGVEHAVKGNASVVRHGDEVDVKTEFPTQISDYKIESPGFKGVTVADQVKVDVNFNGKLEGGKR